LSSLSLAEFAYNNNVHSNIGHSPFVANYGFDPRTSCNLIDPPIELIPQQNNHAVLERLFFTVHKLIVDQLRTFSQGKTKTLCKSTLDTQTIQRQ
jgi:hypothetical protein